MSEFQIISDSSCDFSESMYEKLNLKVVPLIVNFRNQTIADYNDDSLKEIYAGLRSGEAATTSAVNPEGWARYIRPTLEQGKDALVLVFSSGLSTTYQSAVIAADELMEEFPQRKIYVCDTLCASLGQGLLAWYACKLRDEGQSLSQVRDWVEANKLHLCHFFTVDDLGFLKRGGRISAATAAMGTMLNIKPILHVDDEGHLVSIGKVRGRKTSIETLAAKAAELGKDFENPVMFISHGDCLADAQTLADLLKTKYNIKEVYINYVGAVIGAHSGPGTLALFFMGQHR